MPLQSAYGTGVAWELGPGVLVLPDGARLRGRGLRNGTPAGPAPEWTLALVDATMPPPPDGSVRWLHWPDFRLPRDRDDARAAFAEAHRRALAGERVEVSCGGGRGRTGTALACIAQLAGVPAGDAVAYVREHYDRRAVETPFQRRYVKRFSGR